MTEIVPVVIAVAAGAYAYFIGRESLALHAECGRPGGYYFFWYRLLDASILGRDLGQHFPGCSLKRLRRFRKILLGGPPLIILFMIVVSRIWFR